MNERRMKEAGGRLLKSIEDGLIVLDVNYRKQCASLLIPKNNASSGELPHSDPGSGS